MLCPKHGDTIKICTLSTGVGRAFFQIILHKLALSLLLSSQLNDKSLGSFVQSSPRRILVGSADIQVPVTFDDVVRLEKDPTCVNICITTHERAMTHLANGHF